MIIDTAKSNCPTGSAHSLPTTKCLNLLPPSTILSFHTPSFPQGMKLFIYGTPEERGNSREMRHGDKDPFLRFHNHLHSSHMQLDSNLAKHFS